MRVALDQPGQDGLAGGIERRNAALPPPREHVGGLADRGDATVADYYRAVRDQIELSLPAAAPRHAAVSHHRQLSGVHHVQIVHLPAWLSASTAGVAEMSRSSRCGSSLSRPA